MPISRQIFFLLSFLISLSFTGNQILSPFLLEIFLWDSTHRSEQLQGEYMTRNPRQAGHQTPRDAASSPPAASNKSLTSPKTGRAGYRGGKAAALMKKLAKAHAKRMIAPASYNAGDSAESLLPHPLK
ncbi:hypothetical protein ACFX13_001379 [Malus domestica]